MRSVRHKHLTLAIARLAPLTETSEFFICIGGRRNPDSQGLSALVQLCQSTPA
jgi:cyclophilin family peptidyl-prolyl cis-trans isomerase